MTTVIESDPRPFRGSGAERFDLTDGDIAELFASNRLMGYFRQDLSTGHLYFSAQACEIYGVEPTTGPVNQIEVVSRIHPEDAELMLLTLEERARQGKAAHYIFRVADGAGDYRYVRIVWRHRDNGTDAGEVAGAIYAFLDRVPGVRLLEGPGQNAD